MSHRLKIDLSTTVLVYINFQ